MILAFQNFLGDLSERTKVVIFFVIAAMVVGFVALNVINDEADAENSESTSVAVSANGPDAQEVDGSPSEETGTVSEGTEESTQFQEADPVDPNAPDDDHDTPTDMSVEEQDKVSTAAMDGMVQFYTVYSTEDADAWYARVSPYFTADAGPLSNPPMGDTEGITEGTSVAFDSNAILNFAEPEGPTDKGFSVFVALITNAQFKGSDGQAQVHRTEEFLTVYLTKVDDNWKIVDFDEA